MKSTLLLALATSLALACGSATAQAPKKVLPSQAVQPLKVLRYAFQVAETGFDPAQISDLYSRTIAANIFEAPLTYDFLARPAQVKPQTAVALPEISDDFKRFVFQIRPGIHFADDPAFKGVKRELVAADYVYSAKRHYDPRFKSGTLFQLENAGLLGLSELRKKALADKTPFPYDTEVEGIRALDRYRFEVRVAKPQPRLSYTFADGAVMGAVAREVIEAYPDKSMEHPVGTGPYRLADWKRSSRIVLERNPNYRDDAYDETPAADDKAGQAIAQKLAGRKLPLIDRIEVSIIEEVQPRWLAFLNGEHDMIERLPNEFASIATPNNKLAPNLAKRGMRMERVPLVDSTFFFFNMDHPVVGGYSPDKVALRRALALAYDVPREINAVRYGQAIPAQGMIAPLLSGYDATLKTEMSDVDVPRARALLDQYGWLDKNGDGWRDQPDGSPLVLEYSAQPDQLSRKLQEVVKKSFDAVNVKVEFKIAKWPEQLKSSRAGKLMMWGVAWSATNPDGQYFLDLLYGPNKGQANHSRFNLPAFNAVYEKLAVLPDGPEREALMRQAKLLAVAYMPYKVTGHRIATDLMHAPLVGYKRHPFMRDWWRYVDIEEAAPQ
jgi:ABC-type transport system substrate-binding protein